MRAPPPDLRPKWSLTAACSKIRIYTRTGDKGSSSLFNGTRCGKDEPVFRALGDADELNATIGVALEHCVAAGNGMEEKLAEVQSRLLDAGSAIATPLCVAPRPAPPFSLTTWGSGFTPRPLWHHRSSGSSTAKIARVAFSEAHVEQLEQWIDELDAALPPLRNFILPVRSRCAQGPGPARLMLPAPQPAVRRTRLRPPARGARCLPQGGAGRRPTSA